MFYCVLRGSFSGFVWGTGILGTCLDQNMQFGPLYVESMKLYHNCISHKRTISSMHKIVCQIFNNDSLCRTRATV